MRKVLFILFIYTCTITISCTKDKFNPKEWGIEPKLEISPLATILTPSHPKDTIRITTNYIDFRVSKPYWVNIEKIEDASAVMITAKEMTNNDEYRDGYITITIQRGKYKLSRDFVVMQFKEDVINHK